MGDITINQKNVITQSGTAEPVIASNVVFPAGHVINSWGDRAKHGSVLTVANTGAQVSNPDSLTGCLTGSRCFLENFSVAVNVSSTTSDLMIIATNGLEYTTMGDKGAFGFVLNVPSPSANLAYDTSPYPYYQATGSWGGNRYPSSDHQTLYLKGSDSLVKSGAYNIKIYGFAYNESGASTTQNYRCYSSSLAIFEIKK